MRVFAGPNGSGKTTVLEDIERHFSLGFYVNADDIEKLLLAEGRILLKDYGVENLTETDFLGKISAHSIAKKAIREGLDIDLKLEGEWVVISKGSSHSYEAALLADILRHELLNSARKFTFETVMSHPSKVEFLAKSHNLGYKNYLYFVSTEGPDINLGRVNQRYKLGGHGVPEDKIIQRYYKSLELLQKAVKNTYRAFIFDNSGPKPSLILEVFQGKSVTFYETRIPGWVDKFLLNR